MGDGQCGRVGRVGGTGVGRWGKKGLAPMGRDGLGDKINIRNFTKRKLESPAIFVYHLN